jgi:thymidylate kinase
MGWPKVVQLCEKEIDPYRAHTISLIKNLASNPSPDLEREVCEHLANGRAWISEYVIGSQSADSIILIDRWYPSDAAFRRTIPFSEVLKINVDRKVLIADLHVGVTTNPEISWARAAGRARGLNSVVINTIDEHAACTAAFDAAIASNGWLLCRNEKSVNDAVEFVMTAIRAL